LSLTLVQGAPKIKLQTDVHVSWRNIDRFLRARASIAITRISYGNFVCLSVCPSVTTRYQSKTRWDRDFV